MSWRNGAGPWDWPEPDDDDEEDEDDDPWEPIPGGSRRVGELLIERRNQIEQAEQERQESGGDETPPRR